MALVWVCLGLNYIVHAGHALLPHFDRHHPGPFGAVSRSLSVKPWGSRSDPSRISSVYSIVLCIDLEMASLPGTWSSKQVTHHHLSPGHSDCPKSGGFCIPHSGRLILHDHSSMEHVPATPEIEDTCLRGVHLYRRLPEGRQRPSNAKFWQHDFLRPESWIPALKDQLHRYVLLEAHDCGVILAIDRNSDYLLHACDTVILRQDRFFRSASRVE